MLVCEEGEELWIPIRARRGEELNALIAEAREAGEGPSSNGGGRSRAPTRSPFRAGFGLIGPLALLFWVVESRTVKSRKS